MSEQTVLLPVILSGGSGTRLWPLSRETHPKQLLPLTGKRTMLQETALRAQGLGGEVYVAPPMVVCNAEYRFMTAEQLQATGLPFSPLLLEPFGRNTAPALTVAALEARYDDVDPILLVMPADHVIGNLSAFHAAIQQGLPAASAGGIVTFGIVPTHAETGYGYIKQGKATEEGGYQLDAFAEKPDAATAAEYLTSGNYLWNSGLFMLRASVWLNAVGQLNPTMLTACTQAMKAACREPDFIRIDPTAFESCPSNSIDYEVMEPLSRRPRADIPLRVVPLDAGWSDLGAWDALWEVLEKDPQGNAVTGPAMLENTQNSLLFSSKRLLATVGVKDLIVVETADAVLVADKQYTQDVKKIVTRLKNEGHGLANAHRKVYRPWGWYDSIDSGERFQVKRIVVKPGASLSLQMHHHRAEHWVVVSGTAEVTNGDKTFLLGENQSTFIPLGHVHRLANPGKVPLEIIEVQSGNYLGEDDIVRFEDTYGRVDLKG